MNNRFKALRKALTSKRLFWIGFTLYIITILIVIGLTNTLASYSAKSDTYHKIIYTDEYHIEDYGSNVTYPLTGNVNFRLHTEDGPFVSGRSIKPHSLYFANGIYQPSGFKNISTINYTFRIHSPERMDYSHEVIWVELKDIKDAPRKLEIDLTKKQEYECLNYSFGGEFNLDTPGLKQTRCYSEISLFDDNGNLTWFDTESEEDSYNQIEIASIDVYQQYFHRKISVVGIVASAVAFSIPATFKTLKEIYPKKDNIAREGD